MEKVLSGIQDHVVLRPAEFEAREAVSEDVKEFVLSLVNDEEVEIPSVNSLSKITNADPIHIPMKISEIDMYYPGLLWERWEGLREELPDALSDNGLTPQLITLHRILNLLPAVSNLRDLYMQRKIDETDAQAVASYVVSKILELVSPDDVRKRISIGNGEESTIEDFLREAGSTGINPQRKVSPEEMSMLLRELLSYLKDKDSRSS